MSSSTCEPNPDVAGPGVRILVEFVVRSILTILKVIGAFITTAVLTLLFSWIQLIRFRIRVKDKYAGGRQTIYQLQLRRLRKAVPAAIDSFGVAQIVTGFALLAGTIREYGFDKTDKHAVIGAALALLAISSHIPPMLAIIRTREMPTWSIVIRLAVGITEVLVLTIFMWSGETSSEKPLSAVTTALQFTTIAQWVCAIASLFVGWYSTLGNLPAAMNAGNHGTRIIAGASSLLTAVLLVLVLVLYLKFNTEGCDLRSAEDSEMSFGQFFTILMLAAPVLSFVESLFCKSWCSSSEGFKLTSFQ